MNKLSKICFALSGLFFIVSLTAEAWLSLMLTAIYLMLAATYTKVK